MAIKPAEQQVPNDDDMDRARWGLLDAKLLDPDCGYDGWFRVGVALKALGDRGLELWDAWSQSSKDYDHHEITDKWPGLNGSSIASLFGMFDDATPAWRKQYERATRPASARPDTNAGEPDRRATVHPAITPFHEMMTISLNVIALRNDVAVRDGFLVHLRPSGFGGPPLALPVARGLLREWLSRAIRWKPGLPDDEEIEASNAEDTPPADVVAALAEARHEWPGIPILREESAADVESAIAAMLERGPRLRLKTGLDELDAAIGGGMPVDRIFLIGAPDAGKTLLQAKFAHGFAQQDVAVGFHCYDEDREDVLQRFVQRHNATRAECEAQTGQRFEGALRGVRALPLKIYDASWTIERAALDLAEFAAQQEGRRMALFIDSVQTCRSDFDDPEGSEYVNVTRRTEVIKAIARQFKALVLVTSEMNREAYKGQKVTERGSEMAAGKNSGKIEYSARLLLSLKAVPNEPGRAELRIVKSKFGARTPEGKPGISLVLDTDAQNVRVDSAFALPHATDSNAGRADRARKTIVTTAAGVTQVMHAQPGLSITKLRGAVRSTLGTASNESIEAALAHLCNAVHIERGLRNAELHYLHGEHIPGDVMEQLPIGNQAALRATRPPSAHADAGEEDQ